MLESPTAKIGMLLPWSSFEGSFDLATVGVPPRVICRKQTVMGCRNWPLSVPFIPIMCKGSPVFKEYIRILLLPKIKKSFSCRYDAKLKLLFSKGSWSRADPSPWACCQLWLSPGKHQVGNTVSSVNVKENMHGIEASTTKQTNKTSI